MRKTLVLLMTLLLLIPHAYAAESPATVLCFGSDAAVNSIYGSYEVLEEAAEVSVTFADGVKNFSYANFVDGKLWIAVASVESIDLSEPIGWVTAKDANGREFAPTLEVSSLKFNGDVAKCNLVVESVRASLKGDALAAVVEARDDFLGSYPLIVSAYDAHGRMLSSGMKTAVFDEAQKTFAISLTDCKEASCVKAFFLSSEWRPIALAEEQEISK